MGRHAPTAFVDTNVMIWLYGGMFDKISSAAQSFIKISNIVASPMSILELRYLQEVRKISVSGPEIIKHLHKEIGLHVDSPELLSITDAAMDLSWTRDPFDRLIVAHASMHGAFLISSYRRIATYYKLAIW